MEGQCQCNGCWCLGSLSILVIREDYVNTMVADVLALCMAWSSGRTMSILWLLMPCVSHLVIREDCQYNGCWCPGSLRRLVIREDYVNTMVADALAPCIARSSATIVLTMYGKRVFHGEGFWLPAPFQCGKIIESIACVAIYIYIYICAIITWSNNRILHNALQMVMKAEYRSQFEVTKDIPYLILMGELWGISSKYYWEK